MSFIRNLYIFLILCALFLPPPAAAKIVKPWVEYRKQVLGECYPDIMQSLNACSPYKCRQPNPLNREFFIERTIYGKLDDGRCHYTETISDGGLMTCGYTEDMRKGLAGILYQVAAGTMPPEASMIARHIPPEEAGKPPLPEEKVLNTEDFLTNALYTHCTTKR